MFVRKSGRLNRNKGSGQNPRPVKEQPNPCYVDTFTEQNSKGCNLELQQEQSQEKTQLNNTQTQKLDANESEKRKNIYQEKIEPDSLIEVTNSPDKNTSATTKALIQMEDERMGEKKWKKTGKTPLAIRRKKFNQRLSKLLTPKSALILLHELKPGCVYKILERKDCTTPSFCVSVEHDNVVLGTGQGLSKSQAKNAAAESAIKAIVLNSISRHSKNTADETNVVEMKESDDSSENIPWAGLASFAIYKMFNEWQTQETDLLHLKRLSFKHKSKDSLNNSPVKKVLPANAIELHPAVVLNVLYPGLTATEVERVNGPESRVKMGYTIDGKMFTGVGKNKKDAKKEAAKAALENLYGLNYP